MAASGAAVAYCVTGGLVLFSGIKGSTLSDTAKAVLSGNLKVTGTEAITSPAASAGSTSGAGGGTAGSAAASASESSWIQAFLSDLGAPATASNVASVEHWITREKPAGDPLQWNNPLNLGTPGSTSAGRIGTYPAGPGIAEYDTPADGAHAAAEFLESNGYPAIVMLLRAGHGLQSGAESDLLKWSGGAYSSV